MKKMFGVIGDPISHSLSPLIHNGWMKELKIDAEYNAIHIPDGDFDRRIGILHDQGFLGLNVTLPHKKSAAKVGKRSKLVDTLGVANTLSRLDNRKWRANNTDVEGFKTDLKRFLPLNKWRNLSVTILGAGGSANAVAYVLDETGAILTIANRTIAKAKVLVEGLKGSHHKSLSLEEGIEAIDPAGLVINSTSIGYGDDSLNLPSSEGGYFYDLSYGQVAEKALGEARDLGWKTRDGLGMLVEQAADSFRIWFGIDPDVDSALARCRSMLGND